jgi:predicted O-methyltransferase YrrM
MTQAQWSAVDSYLTDLIVHPAPALAAALMASAGAGLPSIAVSAPQGKFLMLLAKMMAARNILEIGTLGGYSTIWMARALPAGGRLVTLENDAKHAAVAQRNIEHAGLAGMIELRLAPAIETLPRLVTEGRGPFDFIFIDADKPGIPDYFAWSLQLARRGTVIVVDNVVRDGAVIDAESTDANVRGVRRFNDVIAAEPRVSATTIQTVGSKGYDGFTLALVIADQ